MIKKMIICLVFIGYSLKSFALDGPKITGIKEGQVAPFSGVLMNTEAAAKILTQKDYNEEECKIQIQYEVDKEIMRITKELEKIENSKLFLEKRYLEVIEEKNLELDSLRKISIENTKDYSLYWFAGGTLLGIGLTIGISFAVAESQK